MKGCFFSKNEKFREPAWKHFIVLEAASTISNETEILSISSPSRSLSLHTVISQVCYVIIFSQISPEYVATLKPKTLLKFISNKMSVKLRRSQQLSAAKIKTASR